MAATSKKGKKNKPKLTTAGRAKGKSKTKVKKESTKVKKSKSTKTVKTKTTGKKAAQVKTKPKAKSPIKATATKTTKAKTKIKASTTTAKNTSKSSIHALPSHVAVMQPYVAEKAPSDIIKTTKPYMDAEQLKHFKNLLEQWKRELMEEVDHTLGEMKEAGVLADPNDCATQEETFSLELRTRDRERKLLKKIEEALQKIDDEEYGYCESCGIEIGINRLEARPTATLCIDCKTLDEIKEKRSQDGS